MNYLVHLLETSTGCMTTATVLAVIGATLHGTSISRGLGYHFYKAALAAALLAGYYNYFNNMV